MYATELLKQDHREVESLIAALEDAGTASNDIFEKLKASLKQHTEAEETIFYPAMEEFDETGEMVEEAYAEHDEVDQLLEEMTGLNPQEDDFQELLAQLKDSINHHVEEEENEMFPQAEELLGAESLEAMGNEIEQMKNDPNLSRTASVR